MEKITKRTVATYILTAINIWLWGDFVIAGIRAAPNFYDRGKDSALSAIVFIIIPALVLGLSIAVAFFYERAGKARIALRAEILFIIVWFFYALWIFSGGV